MPPWLDHGRLRSAELDLRGAQALHRAAARPALPHLLALCSRLADGPLWVALLLALPWLDRDGTRHALLMLELGALDLVIYYALKHSTRRQRPFERCDSIHACLKVPDAFSFPSGHTSSAVVMWGMLAYLALRLAPPRWQVPVLVLAVAMALSIAASRVFLQVHYLTDILAGLCSGAAWLAVCIASLEAARHRRRLKAHRAAQATGA